MLATKSVRFFAKYAATDPVKFSDMVRRRLIERFSETPGGLAATCFRAVNYEIDLTCTA